MTQNPLNDPTLSDALRHPGDVEALRAPGVTDPHRAPTEPGHDSEVGIRPPTELSLPPPGVPPLPCDATPGCALSKRHDGACMPPSQFAAGQARFATHEAACERVRVEVKLPTMGDSYVATRELHRALRAAQNVVHVWADVGDEMLGEICRSSPGIHAAMMNVSGFAAQGAEQLDRAVGTPSLWAEAFESIVSSAGRHRAYRLLAMASGALMAGPFTETWDNAMEWCIAYWSHE